MYCDAAFGIDANHYSRTGIVILTCGTPVLCKSNELGMVTMSNSDAELFALCDGNTAFHRKVAVNYIGRYNHLPGWVARETNPCKKGLVSSTLNSRSQ